MSVRQSIHADKSTASLLADLTRYYSDSVTLTEPDNDALVLAAWTLHAAMAQSGQHCTYLIVNSDSGGCGKSELMLAISKLLPASYLLSMPSVAALQRRAENILLIDQADTLLQARSTDIQLFTGWLNSGHTNGFSNPLSDPNDITATIQRSPFGSRALSGIGIANILDDSIMARSVTIHMQPQSLNDAKRNRPSIAELDKVAVNIAARILDWTEIVSGKIVSLLDARYTSLSDGTEIHSRDYDIWGPLIEICRLANGDWYKRISASVLNGINPNTGERLTAADRIDTELLMRMLNGRITVYNWYHGPNNKDRPIPDQYNFPIRNEHLGWPIRKFQRDKLPEASLKLDVKNETAELRFNNKLFYKICDDLKIKKSIITDTYMKAGRIRGTGNRPENKTNMYSGHKADNLIVIDVSHWFWTDQPPGMSRVEKAVERMVRESESDNPWKE